MNANERTDMKGIAFHSDNDTPHKNACNTRS